jgi:hypothetical protein
MVVIVKIYINGGLGNQLFQWVHMHLLVKDLNVVPEIWKDQGPRDDRPFELGDLLSECDHHKGVSTINSGIKPLIRKLSKLLKIKSYKQYEILPEQKEFEFGDLSKNVTGKSLVQGYFQNWQYVESAWDAIEDELNSHISKVRLPVINNVSRPIVILHIRRGDLKLQSTTVGLLHLDYYLNCLSDIRGELEKIPHIVIITDDPDSASSLINAINPDQVLSPGDATAWQCLALMRSASYVVAANSTLSWWGSYLCFKSGGKAFIPRPWFKNFTPNAGSSFEYPGFKIMQSSFE